ncbi:VWA domain containing CoxE-like protein [Planctomycetes bacterium Pla163]|uniref:VWA domain containing CoxE-like protein n=1 Tax=Rohdeia mirabilis TaxID=2528008 RepID=A0A518CWE8_9BACT|nr:VWA domain containing CoxE-like protein [Planctomycetes bacterium Pla163]
MSMDETERRRRWRLILGEGESENCRSDLGERDSRLDRALSALYQPGSGGTGGGRRRGGLGASAPNVARWLGDIREFFPSRVVQLVQRDAMERLGLRQMLLEPELMASLEADVHLVADLIALRSAMPEETLATARSVVQKVVDELMQRLERRTAEAVRGALDRTRRTTRPRPADIDWPRTITRNLHTWLPEHRTIVPERLVGHARRARTLADLDEIVLCIDQSGSMATSVVYASIFAAVLASLPTVATRLICFDTAVVDLTDDLSDPVQALFGVQLGGGTDIAGALAYVSGTITRPRKTHLVLVTDLCEGGDAEACVALAAELVASGVNLVVLLALSDDGAPYYDPNMASRFAGLGCPVFGCTPDAFPDLMATALRRGDVHAWAAENGITSMRSMGEG